MPTQLDVSLGLKKETVFGTAVTVDHHMEINSESLKFEPEYKTSQGLRVGSIGDRSARRALVGGQSSGDFEVDALSSGMGRLFDAAVGPGVSTVVAGSVYQQLFTPDPDDFPTTYTLQKALPWLGGARQSQTYRGMMCTGFELTAKAGDLLKLKTSWVGKDMIRDVAVAAPSYPTAAEVLSFAGASVKLGGTVTPPTTTALATGGTALANIRDFSVKLENNLDGNGKNMGGGGLLTRPKALGRRVLSGKFTAEYDSDDLLDAYLDNEPLALVLNFAGAAEIAAGVVPVLQITVPDIRLDGEVPAANGGDVITQSIDFSGYDPDSAQMIYVALVTLDTAI